jgi:hypothetical protein
MRIVTYQELVGIALNAVESLVEQGGKPELRDQGHVATGRGIASLSVKVVKSVGDTLRIGIEGNDYLLDLDTGIPPNKVDLSAAAQARFLEWVKIVKPALSDSNQKRFTFLTLNKAAVFGFPLPGAYAFTKNGRRTEWIKFGLEMNAERIIEEQFKVFELLVENFDEIYQAAIQEARNIAA